MISIIVRDKQLRIIFIGLKERLVGVFDFDILELAPLVQSFY